MLLSAESNACSFILSIRHNDIRDLTARLLTEVCPNVAIEPDLQPLSGETLSLRTSNSEDGARLDMSAQGFWGDRHERAFFDVRLFNPLAPNNCRFSFSTTYRRHEATKKRSYEQRVREIEHGSFTPLVFSASGGMAPAATITFKILASLLAENRQQEYNKTIAWIRCQLSFSLVRSSVMCLRGARSSYHRPARPSPWTWSSQKGTSQRTKELWTLHRQFSLLTFYTLMYFWSSVCMYNCLPHSSIYRDSASVESTRGGSLTLAPTSAMLGIVGRA